MLARHREMSLDLISTASFDGHFVDVNPAWKKVFGFELEELTSRPFVEFIHPDDLERTLAEVDKQAKTGELVFNFQRTATAVRTAPIAGSSGPRIPITTPG